MADRDLERRKDGNRLAEKVDRRTVVRVGLTAVAGGFLGGWRRRGERSERSPETAGGTLTASLTSNGERYLIAVTYQHSALGGPYYLEALATDQSYLGLVPLEGNEGYLELIVDLWELPEGKSYILTLVDGAHLPISGIASVGVEAPTYPWIGTEVDHAV